jgi:predicted ribosome quality control (RQC) complex YloA/Tae2 family protein
VLEAVMADLQASVGGRVQDIRQPNATDIVINIYAGGEAMLLLSCHPIFFRMHFATRRPGNQSSPPQFLSALRARLIGNRMVAAEQMPGERMVILTFEGPSGGTKLVAELMGKHSNLILLDQDERIVGAAKWVGRSKSSRPIQAGSQYLLPPVLGGEARRSKFYELLVAAGATMEPQPVLAPGFGAYPVSVSALGVVEHNRESISIALEQHYSQEIPRHEAEGLRASLLGQLDRVRLARDTALFDLRQAEEAGGRAPVWQRQGELILAFGSTMSQGSSVLNTFDYDGSPIAVRLDPELDFRENANAYFEKAKHAKARLGQVADQIRRLSQDLVAIELLRTKIELAERLIDLQALQDEARKHRWLMEQRASGKAKEDRPFEGHRVRELRGPGGFTVLYGETAEANDYLTLRVARPNDYWLHIRGAVSAHVVIQTNNHPEKVQKELLIFAAELAVRHSPSKHAGYVAVDYTLKKYVRKPRGAARGAALYTHEKTLHVES